MRYELCLIDELRPLELVFAHHLSNISSLIHKDGAMQKAIIADRQTGTILDGSHRYAFLLAEGYRQAPVRWVDYLDEDIRVGTKLSHRFLIEDETGISKQECLRRSATGELFNPRTTRHFFPFRKTDINLSLDSLRRGPAQNIDHLISPAILVDELQHNQLFIHEIDDELQVISRYVAEMVETKAYLNQQIAMLTAQMEIGFFPGKFHPPHMGHVRTILNLKPHYKKLIIGVTQDIPSKAILSQADIVALLSDIFASMPTIEIVAIEGVLIKKQNLEGLPSFDRLLSGNPDVLAWGQKHHCKTKLIPRSFSDLCSGETLRKLLQNDFS